MTSGGSQSFGGGRNGRRIEKEQVTLAKSLCGAVIGPGGHTIRSIRRDSKASITIGEETESKDRVITIEGTFEQIQTAQYLLQQTVIAEFGVLGNNNVGSRESQQVTIPKSMGGAIIGPAGARIRKIRRDSEALIRIGEVNEQEERVITVEGTEKQIQTALYLLQCTVKEQQDPGEWGDHAEQEMNSKSEENWEWMKAYIQFLEESIKKKEKNIECPVCLEAAAEPPIFGCKEFHLLCASCRLAKPEITKCPQCRMSYGEQGPVRNRFAEREAEELLELKEQLDRINSV